MTYKPNFALTYICQNISIIWLCFEFLEVLSNSSTSHSYNFRHVVPCSMLSHTKKEVHKYVSGGYNHNSAFYHTRIGSIYPTPLLSYFSVIMCLMWLHHHVLAVSCISPKKLLFLSFITVQYYDVRKSLNTLWLDGHIRLFAHHTTSSWLFWRY